MKIDMLNDLSVDSKLWRLKKEKFMYLCKTCKNGVRKPPFNDIKCMKLEHFIYNETSKATCKHYVSNKTTTNNKEHDNDNNDK